MSTFFYVLLLLLATTNWLRDEADYRRVCLLTINNYKTTKASSKLLSKSDQQLSKRITKDLSTVLWGRWAACNEAYLDFTCYATEAVKKEHLITWTLTIKPTEYNNQIAWSPVYKYKDTYEEVIMQVEFTTTAG